MSDPLRGRIYSETMTDLQLVQHTILGVRVHAVTMKDAVDIASSMIESGDPHLVATANAEMIMRAQTDDGLFDALNTSDLVVPDGAGVLWAGEKLHTPFPERVAGADFAAELLKKSIETKWPVYFLGGSPGVAVKAARRFMDLHGEFRLAGTHDGYFTDAQEADIIEEIKRSGTKLLLVGMGVPKQELWMKAHKNEFGPLLAIGVGGSFDVMAGMIPRAPLWMQKNRLEWAYRLYRQPSRIGRMMAIPKFMRAVLKWKQKREGSGC